MKVDFSVIWQSLVGGGVIAAIIYVAGSQLGWIRFRKKDEADVEKRKAEVVVDLADADNKRIDDEVKISKAALEWTVQLAVQLEKSNMRDEKKQMEIDGLRNTITTLRKDFEDRVDVIEALLEKSQKELEMERVHNIDVRKHNQELIERIKIYIKECGEK